MTDNIFDHLLPPPRELEAFVAAQVMGWQDVHWHPAQAIYVGTHPDEAVETPVPQFTECSDDEVIPRLFGHEPSLGVDLAGRAGHRVARNGSFG